MDSTSFANSSGLPTRFGFNESFFNNSAFGTALSNGVSNNPKETQFGKLINATYICKWLCTKVIYPVCVLSKHDYIYKNKAKYDIVL